MTARKSLKIPDQHKLVLLLSLVTIGLAIWFFREPPGPTLTPIVVETLPQGNADLGKTHAIPMHAGTVEVDPARMQNFKSAPSSGTATVSRSQFRDQADQLLRDLPRKAQLRQLKAEEVHGPPAPIRQAAAEMGKIADLIAKNPDVKPEALDFYQRCSLTVDLATSIRALCLNRARGLSRELTGRDWSFDRDQIPSAVLGISEKL